MGTIVIMSNVTLDGVVQDPDGQEGFERGGWFVEAGGSDLDAWAGLETEEALGASALLLGRRSDAWFGARWNGRDGAWADRLNALPKYVVSTALAEPVWRGGTVLRRLDDVAALKDRTDGEILVYASYELVRALLDHGLADELRLVVFPVVAGQGRRLFDDVSGPARLRRLASRELGDGLVVVTYGIVSPAPAR
ncbi:dihydrofolate reductase family protein [Luteimicrobium sp. NPDC057192]|uniref:dihydrofolate reductase family protein n=1 Tax=Luteimicrobium sp. NPDC057192 TaxID=3346042 RepID=UPI0036379B89